MESNSPQKAVDSTSATEDLLARSASPGSISRDTPARSAQAQLTEGGDAPSLQGTGPSASDPVQATRFAPLQVTEDPIGPSIAVVSTSHLSTVFDTKSLLNEVVLTVG